MKTESQTTNSKEVLHTQGEWWVGEFAGWIFVRCGEKQICRMPGLGDSKANAELICKAVNERETMIEELQNAVSAYDEAVEMNIRLVDSNRELLEKLNELHHYVSGKVKGYKNVHDSLYFEVINLMANGLHNKIK